MQFLAKAEDTAANYPGLKRRGNSWQLKRQFITEGGNSYATEAAIHSN
jgi:hypothetical protein